MKNDYNFYFLFLVIFGIGSPVSAQRYSQVVFDEVASKTVVYRTKGQANLAMDIFSPVGDSITNRPVLLYVHGGGFSGGKRDHADHLAFCENLAKRGFIAITMSYTLVMKGKSFGCDLLAKAKIETFKSVALDIAYATKYLIANKSKLGINENQIILAGSSAGAEAVLHAAYMKEVRRNAGAPVLKDSFRFGGVISMAGAIADISLIDSNSAIPTQLFHGTCDNLVPYGTAPHHYCDTEKPGYLILHGAGKIAERLAALDRSYFLVTGCQGGHEWNSLPIRDYRDLIADFIYNDVMLGAHRQQHIVKPSSKSCSIEAAILPSACEER